MPVSSKAMQWHSGAQCQTWCTSLAGVILNASSRLKIILILLWFRLPAKTSIIFKPNFNCAAHSSLQCSLQASHVIGMANTSPSIKYNIVFRCLTSHRPLEPQRQGLLQNAISHPRCHSLAQACMRHSNVLMALRNSSLSNKERNLKLKSIPLLFWLFAIWSRSKYPTGHLNDNILPSTFALQCLCRPFSHYFQTWVRTRIMSFALSWLLSSQIASYLEPSQKVCTSFPSNETILSQRHCALLVYGVLNP